MHFSRGLPLATFLLLSLSSATPVPGNFNTDAVAVRRIVASGPAVAPVHATHSKRSAHAKRQDTAKEEFGVYGDNSFAPDDTTAAFYNNDGSSSSDASSSGNGDESNDGGDFKRKARRQSQGNGDQGDGDVVDSDAIAGNDGPEKFRRDDSDDDRYGFGPGSDGWKKARRDEDSDGSPSNDDFMSFGLDIDK